MTEPHLIILGAGPAGLGAASQAARLRSMKVTVLEKNGWVGGNASSFELAGIAVDYGSHRLHPSCDPKILSDIQDMLGDDLLDRPRHGRIRLRNRWIHFPLKPLDLAMRLPATFTFGVIKDGLGKLFPQGSQTEVQDTFASLMVRELGQTICQDFYFPYARKLWGLAPEELSVTQARRRVASNSLSKMIRKTIRMLPGVKSSRGGRFFYPRKGFGQISQAYYRSALNSGAEIILGAAVRSIRMVDENQFLVHFNKGDQLEALTADLVWSTIPITTLVTTLEPPAPEELIKASQEIDYRAMLLIYLVLEQDRFSEFDAHYFPETTIRISRLSEPKNYSDTIEPKDRTVLCAELPCSPEDPEWQFSDGELGALTLQALASAGIPVRQPLQEVVVRRLRFAYPIYRQGYEKIFDQLDEWTSRINGLLTFGRQGLFAHDNTHHALFMAYSAVSCLDEQGRFDYQRWSDYRRIFETHVVED